MKKLLFVDTETTGLEAHDRICQVAYKLRKPDGENLNEPEVALFRPPVPISFEAMATHHITNAMVEDKESFVESGMKKTLDHLDDCLLVAHNAPFDVEMLAREGVKFPVFIDTLRVARHLIDLLNHKLQYLRYALDLNVSGTAHDAQGDVNVLVGLFDHLLGLLLREENISHQQAVDKMVTLTNLPVLLKRLTFGKHEGKSFKDVAKADRQYLVWLYSSEKAKLENEQNEDMVYTLERHLQNKYA